MAAIEAHVQRANFVLVTHTHCDHVLDVPQIALKTHAVVIGTESTEHVLRAYKAPEEQQITVHGGKDYEFGAFSLKVIPSLHSPLDHKHYFISEIAPEGMKAPLTLPHRGLVPETRYCRSSRNAHCGRTAPGHAHRQDSVWNNWCR